MPESPGVAMVNEPLADEVRALLVEAMGACERMLGYPLAGRLNGVTFPGAPSSRVFSRRCEPFLLSSKRACYLRRHGC